MNSEEVCSEVLQINPTRCTILLSVFIFLLYMFRATMCPSSEEIIVSMRQWCLSLCMGGVWSASWSFAPISIVLLNPVMSYLRSHEDNVPIGVEDCPVAFREWPLFSSALLANKHPRLPCPGDQLVSDILIVYPATAATLSLWKCPAEGRFWDRSAFAVQMRVFRRISDKGT